MQKINKKLYKYRRNSMKNKIILLGITSFLFITCSLSKTVNEVSKTKKASSRVSSADKSSENTISSKKLFENLQEENKSPNKSQRLSRSVANKGVEITNSSGLLCFSSYEDEFSPSYVQISSKCDVKETLCLGFNSTLKSWCKEDNKTLMYYYCNAEKEDLVSIKDVECEESCVSGACTR